MTISTNAAPDTAEMKAVGAFLAAMHDNHLDGGKMREAMIWALGASPTTQTAPAPAAQPPAGWVMVPPEATEAMRAAAVKYANGTAVYKNVSAEALRIEEGIYGEVYEAMLAAAPNAEPAQPDFADAYQGAREDLAIWKRRALEAERDLRKERETSSRLAAEINAANGPTHLGDPAQPERVPLTEAQLKQIHHIEEFGLFCDYSEFEQIARDIELAHGIKPKEQP